MVTRRREAIIPPVMGKHDGVTLLSGHLAAQSVHGDGRRGSWSRQGNGYLRQMRVLGKMRYDRLS